MKVKIFIDLTTISTDNQILQYCTTLKEIIYQKITQLPKQRDKLCLKNNCIYNDDVREDMKKF